MKKIQRIKRASKILKLVHKGETYESIGKKFNISKQCVWEMARKNGINRLEDKREFRSKKFRMFSPDIIANLPLTEIAVKHSLTPSEIRLIYKLKTGVTLNSVLSKKRNETIVKKFVSGNTARKIVTDPVKVLNNPRRVSTQNWIYSINTQNGVKRYPEIGDRRKGGTFQSKKAINLIVKCRDKGLKFGEILNEINKKGLKTVTGLEFKVTNINQLYNYAKLKLNK